MSIAPRRLFLGLGAFLLADLITGLAAFSAITLASLWFFSVSWVRLQAEYAARSVAFGSSEQLLLAWVGILITLPLLALVVYLAYRAYRLPVAVFRHARHTAAHGTFAPTLPGEVGEGPYHCPMCSRSFVRLPSWDLHVRSEHPG